MKWRPCSLSHGGGRAKHVAIVTHNVNTTDWKEKEA